MKEYYISKDTTLSGFGKTSGYYHLLIDFIIPLFVHSRGDDILLHVDNRRLDPTFDAPVKPGVLPGQRVKYLLEQVFGDRLKTTINKSKKHCGQIWLTKKQKEQLPLSKVIQNVNKWWRCDFDRDPGHRGIWGEYDQSHYDYFRENMWNKYQTQYRAEKYVTIIERGRGANQRNSERSVADIHESIIRLYENSRPCRVVKFENLTFEETVQVCRDSDVLIGQHGAGLANCVFMEPGTKVAEYGPFKLPCYHVLADSCGLNHERINIHDLDTK